MHLANLDRLATWLEAGAPHAIFDMYYGTARLDEIEEPDPRWDSSGVGECGTVCCIGGAAAQMAEGTLGTIRPDNEDTSWQSIAITGLRWLGFPYDNRTPFGHQLFDPSLAPKDCTPQQAAAAVRRVMEGQNAWA